MASSLVQRVANLVTVARSGKTTVRTELQFDAGEPPFAARQHYLQVVVNELFLAAERKWFVTYEPVALVALTYIYNKQQRSVPMLVGPSLFREYAQPSDKGPAGYIVRDTPVTPLIPYQGGPVTMTVVFSAVQKSNMVDTFLKVVEGLAKAASPVAPTLAISTYLEVADHVMDGVQELMGLSATETRFAFQRTINPQINQDLKPTYVALIDADEQTINKSDLAVVERRLQRKSGKTGESYRENDFVLLQVAQGVKRTDERLLSFYPLYETTRDLAAVAATGSAWDDAKANFNTLKLALLNSPDLTRPDYVRLRDEYLNEVIELRKEAVKQADLALTPPDPDQSDLAKVAAKLNALDEM